VNYATFDRKNRSRKPGNPIAAAGRPPAAQPGAFINPSFILPDCGISEAHHAMR